LEQYISKIFNVPEINILALNEYIKCDIYSSGVMYQFLNNLESEEEHQKIKKQILKYNPQKCLYDCDSDEDKSCIQNNTPDSKLTTYSTAINLIPKEFIENSKNIKPDRIVDKFHSHVLDTEEDLILQKKSITKQSSETTPGFQFKNIQSDPNIKKSDQCGSDKEIIFHHYYHSSPQKSKDQVITNSVNEKVIHHYYPSSGQKLEHQIIPNPVSEEQFRNRPVLRLQPLSCRDSKASGTSSTYICSSIKSPGAIMENNGIRPSANIPFANIQSSKEDPAVLDPYSSLGQKLEDQIIPNPVSEEQFRNRPVLRLKPPSCRDSKASGHSSACSYYSIKSPGMIMENNGFRPLSNIPFADIHAPDNDPAVLDPYYLLQGNRPGPEWAGAFDSSLNLVRSELSAPKSDRTDSLMADSDDIASSKYGNKYASTDEIQIIKNVGRMTASKKKILDEQKIIESIFQK
jgi:hypothetical protein